MRQNGLNGILSERSDFDWIRRRTLTIGEVALTEEEGELSKLDRPHCDQRNKQFTMWSIETEEFCYIATSLLHCNIFDTLQQFCYNATVLLHCNSFATMQQFCYIATSIEQTKGFLLKYPERWALSFSSIISLLSSSSNLTCKRRTIAGESLVELKKLNKQMLVSNVCWYNAVSFWPAKL